MSETCPVCDTLWRLYSKAADNLKELVGKHSDARGKSDRNSLEVLSAEISIAESALRSVRRELRRHEGQRHSQPSQQKAENKPAAARSET